MRRRAALRAIAVATVSAGCVEAPSSTPAEEDCSVAASAPLRSLAVPSEPTGARAESFARSYEADYAVLRAEDAGWTVDGIESVAASARAIDEGFIVEVTVSLDAHRSVRNGTDTEAETLYGSLSYHGWYRVGEEWVERAPGEDAATPPERGWTTVACS